MFREKYEHTSKGEGFSGENQLWLSIVTHIFYFRDSQVTPKSIVKKLSFLVFQCLNF